jgi:dolichol kinase
VLILYAFGLSKVAGVVYLFLLSALLTLSEALFKRDNLSIPIVYVLLLTIILKQLKLF